MDNQQVYCVFCNADLTEGKGPMVLNSIWLIRENAQQHADSLEPYGYPGQFNEVRPMELRTNFVGTKEKDLLEKAKKSGLAKLSLLEREALGAWIA